MFNYSIIWQKEGNIHDGCNEINPDVVDISTIRRNFAGVHSCTRTWHLISCNDPLFHPSKWRSWQICWRSHWSLCFSIAALPSFPTMPISWLCSVPCPVGLLPHALLACTKTFAPSLFLLNSPNSSKQLRSIPYWALSLFSSFLNHGLSNLWSVWLRFRRGKDYSSYILVWFRGTFIITTI